MKLLKLIVLLICALLISSGATVLLYSLYYIVDVKETGMKLVVTDFYGFDLNPVNLTFGAVPEEGSSMRDIILMNTYGTPVRANIEFRGELGPLVHANANHFVLAAGERKNVQTSVTAPQGMPNGTYFGTVRVVFTRPW